MCITMKRKYDICKAQDTTRESLGESASNKQDSEQCELWIHKFISIWIEAFVEIYLTEFRFRGTNLKITINA